MREIVLDTETTGLDPKRGDRLIEIGCIELFDRHPTGAEYHCFINPERDVPAEAEAVHGISTDFLRDKPLFRQVADDFLAFVQSDPLIIHNAPFDMGFLNFELELLGKSALSNHVVDTLIMARRKHPGGSNNLDALCKRYGIDNSKRDKHGALIDSLLLAEVYIELLGERQTDFLAAAPSAGPSGGRTGSTAARLSAQPRPKPLPARLTEAEIEAHEAFVATLGEEAIWLRYLEKQEGR